MKRESILVVLMMFGLSIAAAAQEEDNGALSDEEFETLTEIPGSWTRISYTEDGIPVIREYCDAGTATVTVDILEYGKAAISFFHGQDAESFEVLSVSREDDVYWMEIVAYDGERSSITFSYFPGSGRYAEWSHPYVRVDGVYIDGGYQHCVDVIPAEGCDEY